MFTPMRFLLAIIISVAACHTAFPGISPKNISERHRHASVALIPKGHLEDVKEIISALPQSDSTVRDGYYLRTISGKDYLFRYSETTTTCASKQDSKLTDLLEALPNARNQEQLFEPLEYIFYEAGAADKAPTGEIQRIAMFTELKAEKEAHYRLLHDNPWPDVVKAIRRANFRHFSIFLEEIDGHIYLFGWLEYTGSDLTADGAENKKDPASIRWWRETDACQIAPADSGDGTWGGMQELQFLD